MPEHSAIDSGSMGRGDVLAARIGFWTSAIVTGAGIIYSAGLLGLVMVTGGRWARPSERVQLWVGLATLAMVQLVLAVVACIHRLTARQLG